MTSSQESRDPSSLGNRCFSSGKEFSSTKNKQMEVGRAMRSSSKQKNCVKLRAIPEVTSFVTNLSLRGQTSLGVAKAGNLKLDFMAKSIGIHFFEFEDMFRCLRDNENLKKHFGHMYTLKVITLNCP